MHLLALKNEPIQISIWSSTVEFHRLGQCFLDWATAVVGEADREQTCVTLIYHSSGPIYETSAQFTKSPGTASVEWSKKSDSSSLAQWVLIAPVLMKLRGVRGYEPYWMPRTPEGTSRYNAQGSDSDVYQNKRSIPVETEFREVGRKMWKNTY